jgi:type IV secretory pathway component VirB8
MLKKKRKKKKGLASENSELFSALERRLQEARKEREDLFLRVEQVEKLGAQVVAELKRTQDAIVSSAWLFSGLAVATVVVAFVLNRRWPRK